MFRYAGCVVKPFNKLCYYCIKQLTDIIEKNRQENEPSDIDGAGDNFPSQKSTSSASASVGSHFRNEKSREELQQVFELMNLSPLKIKSAKENQEYLNSKIDDLSNEMRRRLQLSPKKNNIEEHIIKNMRESLRSKSVEEVVKTLALLPRELWSEARLGNGFKKDWTHLLYRVFIKESDQTPWL